MGKLPRELPALSYPGATVSGSFPDDIACKPQPISNSFCLAFVTVIYIHLEEVIICIPYVCLPQAVLPLKEKNIWERLSICVDSLCQHLLDLHKQRLWIKRTQNVTQQKHRWNFFRQKHSTMLTGPCPSHQPLSYSKQI